MHEGTSGKSHTILTGEDFTCGHVTHWKQCFNGCLGLQLCSPLVVNNSFSWPVHLLWITRGWPEVTMLFKIHSVNIKWLQDIFIWIDLLEALTKVLPWARFQVPDKGWLPSQAGSSQCRPASIYISLLFCLLYGITIITYIFLFICVPW